MGLIKEPLNVDFYFDVRQMTDEDQQRVSAFIAKTKVNKKGMPNLDKYKTERKSKAKLHKNEYILRTK
jgi:hypothetical protein